MTGACWPWSMIMITAWTKTKPTGWIRSSMPFLFAMRDSAPVLLTLVNEREETIRSAGVIADQVRFTDTPVRRWFDRRVLREMVREARASRTQE